MTPIGIGIGLVVLMVIGFFSKSNPELLKEIAKYPERIIVLGVPIFLLAGVTFLMWFESSNIGTPMAEIYKQETAVTGLFAILVISSICAIAFPHYLVQALIDKKIEVQEGITLVFLIVCPIICHIYVLMQAHEVYIVSGPSKGIFTIADGEVRYRMQCFYSVLTVMLEILIGASAFDKTLLKKATTPAATPAVAPTSPAPPISAPAPLTSRQKLAAEIKAKYSIISNPESWIVAKSNSGLDVEKIWNNITQPDVLHYLGLSAAVPVGYNANVTFNKLKKT